ncbi:MAG: ABC-F family ATP-binding cassette domain-containing protein [Bacteroidia bacterium]|nr:ABC-F family ATP-binding cassette domain-containing protein [Bacteroidia bacterium]
MNLLSVEGISKAYGEKILFKDINFGLNEGQKVALVARNGSGKTTLLNILSGKDEPDAGNVVFRRGLTIGYLDQDPQFPSGFTVEEAIFHSNAAIIQAVRKYEHAMETQIGLDEAMAEVDRLGAWEVEFTVKQILFQLGITRLNQSVDTLSGGQRKRLALAQVLIDQPDFLILDEPTNHLDIQMIEWLEGYVKGRNLSLLVVTHDRYFLDAVCTEILELEDQVLYRHKGNYAYFLEKKQERELSKASELEKARNLYFRELEWIRKQPKARGTKSKSRVDAFEGIKDKATSKRSENSFELNVKMSRIGGSIIEIKKLNKAYGDLEISKGFSYTFKAGDRIGIVGKNGTGKSTFLNMIAGKEEPDSGKINVGETIVLGYYSQGGLELKEDKRMIEVVKDVADVLVLADGSKLNPTQFLKHFGFKPETHYTFVSKLSGGEKRRLYLLTVLIKNPNVLILDEPTNDLDILTLNILEEFLENFQGVLLMVSHDRYFMDKLVDHLFIFDGHGNIKDFNGNYTDFRMMLEQKEKQDAKDKLAESNLKENSNSNTSKKKIGFKEKFEFQQLEKEIPELEEKKKQLELDLQASVSDYLKIQQLGEQIAQLSSELELKSLRWLELAELVEGEN